MIPEPEVQERSLKEIAEQWADRLKESLLTALDEGWLIFKKARPQERLAGYMANTLSQDMPFVLNPEYRNLLDAGLAPPLLCVQMDEARKVAEVQAQKLLVDAQAMGLQADAPQLPPAPPMLWVYIMDLPPYVFERLSRDFAHVLKAAADREAA